MPAPRDVARMVSIPHVLRELGWRMRSRRRTDCGLCRGSSSATSPIESTCGTATAVTRAEMFIA